MEALSLFFKLEQYNDNSNDYLLQTSNSCYGNMVIYYEYATKN